MNNSKNGGIMDNNYFILDLLYSINDSDYYMKAITVGGDEKKIKLTKKQFLNWCKSYEDDEQGWELSLYSKMIPN